MTRHVLSLWQPWATLCVVRDPLRGEVAKKIETRAFPLSKLHMEPPLEVAIHATKGFDREQRLICKDLDFLKALNARGYFAGSPKRKLFSSALKPLPLGQIIGTARITAVLPADDPTLLLAITEEEKKFGLYRADRWAWILEDPRELPEPIPFSGKQQLLYHLGPGVNAEIDRQLGLALAQPVKAQQNSSD